MHIYIFTKLRNNSRLHVLFLPTIPTPPVALYYLFLIVPVCLFLALPGSFLLSEGYVLRKKLLWLVLKADLPACPITLRVNF